MPQNEFFKFLLEAPTPLLFIQFAIWVFHACNQIRMWVLQKQKDNLSRLFLALSFATLATGFGTTLIISRNHFSVPIQTGQIGLSFWISASFLFSAAFAISAHILNRKIQVRILVTSAALLALGSYALLTLESDSLSPTAFSAMGLAIHALSTFILFRNAHSEKHFHRDTSVDTRTVALGIAIWTLVSLAAMLVWMTVPESPLWVERIHFSLFLLLSIAASLPLMWMQLHPATHPIAFLGVQVFPKTQRPLLFGTILFLIFSFLGGAHHIRTKQTSVTQGIGLDALNSTLLSIHDKIDVLVSAANTSNENTLNTCKSMDIECSFVKTLEVPRNELHQTAHHNGHVFVSPTNSPNRFSLSYYKALLSSKSNKAETFLKVSTLVTLPTSTLLPDAYWIISSTKGEFILKPSHIFAARTETQTMCNSTAKSGFFVMQKEGSLLPCNPGESENVFDTQGQPVLLLSKPLKHFEGNLLLFIPTERFSGLSNLYTLGTILVLCLLASLTFWSILLQLWHNALSSNERKSAMVADLSHELRNPLNAILGNLEILSQGSLNFKQQRILQNTAAASRSMAQIVNDVSDFSKLEAGVLELEFREFELRKTMEQAATNLSYLAATKKLDFTINIEQSVPEFLIGDRQKISQITSNLLSNAIKYTKHGSVELSISCKSLSETQANIRFEIKDTGIGISADAIPKLFKRFSRVGNDDALAVEGTGLGLSIAGFLIEKFGGTIGVDSVVDKGSEFSFSLPLARQKASEEWDQKTSNFLNQKRVLVASNSKTLRTSVANIFLQMGATVFESESTSHTIQLLCDANIQETGYDFVCVDEDSFSFAPFAFVSQLGDLMLKTKPKFIQMTQSLSDHDEELMARHNVMFQITKPVGPRQIYECFINNSPETPESKESARVSCLSRLKPAKDCLRILVAEDNPILQEVTVAQLEALGCEATVAPDGDDAVNALKHAYFDLVLMDVRMPKMNGFHATQAIREMEKPSGHHTPIIAMTGAAMTGDKERCIAAGMDDYISKPINMGDLARVIERQREKKNVPEK